MRDGGMRGRLTHADEREGAARVDCDATRVMELSAVAGAVEEGTNAGGAGERGGRPVENIDTANAVAIFLRCIMGEHTEEELNWSQVCGRTVCGGNRCGPYAVCKAGVPCAGRRDAGEADAR